MTALFCAMTTHYWGHKENGEQQSLANRENNTLNGWYTEKHSKFCSELHILQDYFDYVLVSQGNRCFLIQSLGAKMLYIFTVPLLHQQPFTTLSSNVSCTDTLLKHNAC